MNTYAAKKYLDLLYNISSQDLFKKEAIWISMCLRSEGKQTKGEEESNESQSNDGINMALADIIALLSYFGLDNHTKYESSILLISLAALFQKEAIRISLCL